ncbi:MAG: hypothetical protein VW827_06290 [Alphaproteobacteria bacterium]
MSHGLKEKIGLNWYLVKPELLGNSEVKKNDGEKRKFLSSQEIIKINPDLIEELKPFKNIKNRKIKKFSTNPKFNNFLKFYNSSLSLQNRKRWFDRSLIFFKDLNTIFLDPDNGISFKEQGKKNIKYLNISELHQYYTNGKTVTFTQFQSFNTNYKVYIKRILMMLEKNGFKSYYPVIRNRTGPNTFYITVGNIRNSKYEFLIKSYTEKNDRVELVIL